MPKRTLLIDGDVLAYQKAASVERAINWNADEDDTGENDVWTVSADLERARYAVDCWIAARIDELDADQIAIALSDDANFRKELLPSYKSNRKASRKPVIVRQVREYLVTQYGARIKPGLEGDDVLGILATNPKLYPGEKIIVSIDKDMKTIPGLLVNTGSDEGIVKISEEQADYWHLFQTLTGDQIDGYVGCPGVGPKKAAGLLDLGDVSQYADRIHRLRALWEAIVAAYGKCGLTEQDALVQARVARILRHGDYDYKARRPILWTPPHP
jgi:DNA polymerase-1